MYNGVKAVSLMNGICKIGQVHAKTMKSKKKKETRPLTYSIHKNKLKMDKRVKCKL